jgi:putative FmdB family regulatory protein
MPLYEYLCESCQRRFERIRKFSDPPIDVCPVCGNGPVKKLLSAPAIQFKGTGWYVTDYTKRTGSDAGKRNEDGKPAGDTKTDAGASGGEKKTEPPKTGGDSKS